ncbi:PLP-dependent aminotransferase family protein, partial [Achromobacter xylosoxidans]
RMFAADLQRRRAHRLAQHAGFHLVWWPPPGIDVAALLARARTLGVGLQPVADFCRRVSWPAGVVIGYSARQEAELDSLEALLREVAGVS